MSRDLKRESKSRLRHLQKGHLGQGPEHVCCVGDIVRKTVVGGRSGSEGKGWWGQRTLEKQQGMD